MARVPRKPPVKKVAPPKAVTPPPKVAQIVVSEGFMTILDADGNVWRGKDAGDKLIHVKRYPIEFPS
tara:strand:- start:109 stop:309 length:201 start_codon:yes stop_codon:yes gene_type:complete